jgi:hypothetical protein
MLYSFPTSHGTGIELRGDYYDFAELYSTSWYLADRLEQHGFAAQHGLVMGFVHEVRHAQNGSREVYAPEHAGPYYGLRLTWPRALVLSNILRQAVALGPSAGIHHSQLYLLEARLDSALKNYDLAGCTPLLELVGTGLDTQTQYVEHLLAAAEGNYLRMPASKTRFRSLHLLLEGYLVQGQSGFQDLIERVSLLAEEKQCEISEIEVVAAPATIVW